MSLMWYRVKAPDNPCHYKEKQIDKDQIIQRRAEMRQILKNTSFADMSNQELDRMRLEKIENGYILEDENGYDFRIRVEITEQVAKNRRIVAMIPRKYINMRMSDFKWNVYNKDTKETQSIISGFINKFKDFKKQTKGLYIYSKTKGSGKTMLACCILNELASRYHENIKFIPILDFMELTKKSFNGNHEELERIYQCGVLVLDDIGVQASKEWVETVLYRIINDRYNKGLITIYTSNVPIDKLKMDERTVDRIESDTFVINMPETPVRKIKTDAEKQYTLDSILKSGEYLSK